MKKELLIFGSNGALGSGVTKVLSEKNYDKIYLFDFTVKGDKEEKNIIRAEIKDLSKEENVKNAFDVVSPGKDKYLFLYTTVGGFAGGKNIWETDTEEWEKMIEMNLTSSFLIAKYFSKLVKQSAGGSICFTAAYTGVEAEAKKAAYGISKSGVVHLVKTLAKEGKELNLSVNAIAPYIIDTKANREFMKEADYSKWIKPEEIGELSNSLFNSFNFVTGNVITLTNRFDLTH